MVLSECYGFVKYALFCVNIVFSCVGLGAVVIALWMLTEQTFLTSLAEEQHNLNAGFYILFAAGFLMLVVAVLGCCGSSRESRCMLVAFFSCLLVLIVAQIAAGTWLHANSNRLEELVKSNVINTVKNKYGEDTAHTDTVDTFQSELKCCGATGPADWTGSKYATKDPSNPVSLTVSEDANNEYKVPESCCKNRSSSACKADRKIKVAGVVKSTIYSEGCVDKLMDILNNQMDVVIGVISGVGILEFFGLTFSIMMCCTIGSSDRYLSVVSDRNEKEASQAGILLK